MKKNIILLLSYTFFILMVGCASAQRPSYSIDAYSKQEVSDNIDENSRIVILSASIVLEVKKVSGIRDKIIELSKELKGYTVSSSNSSVTIRVESDKFTSALKQIGTLGEITKQNIFGEDVTDKYRDIETRLSNAEKSRERYLELLSKAENVTAALSVEKELERITAVIEGYKGQIKRLKHLSHFSTITVTIEEEITPGPVGWIFYGTYHIVKWLFVW